MGCSGSSAAAPQPQVQSPKNTLLDCAIGGDYLETGHPAIVLCSPDSWMRGNQVMLGEYNADFDEWQVIAGRLGVPPMRSDWLKPAPGLKYKGNVGRLVPGMTARIRNCPDYSKIGKEVLCKEFDTVQDMWLVWPKGSRSKQGCMHLGIEMLEPDECVPRVFDPDYPYEKLVTGQRAIIRGCLIEDLNGQQVVCEEYKADLDEWVVKGDGSPLSKGMSLGTRLLEPVPFL